MSEDFFHPCQVLEPHSISPPALPCQHLPEVSVVTVSGEPTSGHRGLLGGAQGPSEFLLSGCP